MGYDGSDESLRALRRALEYAGTFSSRLVVVSVTKSSPALGPEAGDATAASLVAPGAAVPVALAPGAVPPADELDVENSAPASDLAERQRERVRSLVRDAASQVEILSEVGDTAERVLDAAGRRGAGLIVVGSRDRGFFERLFSKPVDEAVAERASADVLVVH